MNHLFVGAVIPFFLGMLWYARRRLRATPAMLVTVPFAMFLCATWAVLPDLPRTFGFGAYDHVIMNDPRIDIFFWHYTINLHESYSPWFNIGFVAMLAALFGAAWRELWLIERE